MSQRNKNRTVAFLKGKGVLYVDNSGINGEKWLVTWSRYLWKILNWCFSPNVGKIT